MSLQGSRCVQTSRAELHGKFLAQGRGIAVHKNGVKKKKKKKRQGSLEKPEMYPIEGKGRSRFMKEGELETVHPKWIGF